ncbi:hypothetical protein ACT7CW_19820 [Bacillus pacificus]
MVSLISDILIVFYLNGKKNGIKTVDQAQNQGRKFRANQQRTQQTTKQETKFTGKVPFYNWLEQ